MSEEKQHKDEPREWLTVTQAAKHCQVSRRTIYNWLAKGLVETATVPSGMPRIHINSLVRRDQ